MAWMKRIIGTNLASTFALSVPFPSTFFSKLTPYIAKVGIPEFLSGIGNGVESHVAKLETEISDFQKLLVSYPQAQEAGHSLQTWPYWILDE